MEEDSTPYRDEKLDEAVVELKTYIDNSMNRHITLGHNIGDEYVRRIKEHDEMVKSTTGTNEMVNRMVILIEGEPNHAINGDVLSYSGGLTEGIDDLKSTQSRMSETIMKLEERAQNGGVPAKVKLTALQKWVTAGFGTAFVYLLVEVLRFIGK